MANRFNLHYSKGLRCGDDKYSIAIPDGFKMEKGAEERAFIAWSPDGEDDYFTANITLFDGKIASENDSDSRLYAPEMCASMLENMFWGNPFLRMMYSNSKFIPLNESHPAGGINAAYDEGCFQYNIQVFFKNCIKTMRVQVQDVSEKDIPACDKMVIDWVKTMKITEPMDTLKRLDDDSFCTVKLTEKLVDEWRSCSDVHYTIVVQTMENLINARSARYKANASEDTDSPKAVCEDCQVYVSAAANKMKMFLEQALNGLEKITKNNPGNPLLQNLYEVLCPAIMGGDSITKNNLGGIKGKVSATIEGYEGMKNRFLVLMPNAEDKVEKKIPNPKFEKPTYNDDKSVILGTMMAKLPDGMVIAAESHSDDESSEDFLEQLRNRYSLVAIPANFKKGFDFYTEGALSINVSKPQQVPQFAALFDKKALKSAGIEMNLQENLVNIVEGLLKQNGKYDEEFPAEYVCGGNEFGIVLEQVEENVDPDENSSQFIFVIFHKSNLYQGNIYFNAIGEREEFRSAAKEWLKTFKVADKKSLDEYNKRMLSDALKTCNLATEAGVIDAVKVSQMFFEDIVFMNDYEVSFNGTHHQVQKLQFNADVQDEHPNILHNMAILWPEIFKIFEAVEKNDSLIIKKKDYHKNLQSVTWNQDITGITIFNLCAAHMLKIVKGDGDNYVVAIDSDLIDGIPEAYAYVAQFIRVLRDYNGLTGPFTAVMASFANFNGGIEENIEKPVKGAAKHEASITISVASGEYPYSKIIEEKKAEIARLKKEQEDRERKEYEEKLVVWKNETSRIKTLREQSLNEKVTAEKELRLKKIEDEKSHIIQQAETIKQDSQKKKALAEEELSSLGFFKLSEKKNARQTIENMTAAIEKADRDIATAEEKYSQAMKSLAHEMDKFKEKTKKDVEKRYQLPEEPKKPSFMR